jgi:MFS superfamily sulfate permease-like transporter
MSDKHSLAPATKKEIEAARATGQVIGFAQGVGAALLVGVALKFLGWIPFIAVGGAVVYVGYRLLFRRKGKKEEEGE